MEDVFLRVGRFSNTNRDVPGKTRWKVYRRDGWRCQVCLAYCPVAKRNVDYTEKLWCVERNKKHSRKFLTVDHVVPKKLGSTNHKENLVTLCNQCNNAKKDLLPVQWFRSITTGARKRVSERTVRAQLVHIMEAE